MVETLQKVALFGASGHLGQPLLPALLAANFEVTVVVRESGKQTRYPPQANIIKISDAYTKPELLTALQNQDAVIIAFNHSANAAHHRTIIDAAAEAGVKHLIPNHWSSNAELPIVRSSSERQEALDSDIDYLSSTHSASNMIWTAIVTGIFFDLAFPFGLLGFNLKGQTAEIWDSGDATFSASTNEDIAKARSRCCANQRSQNQLLALAENVSGTKWEVKHVTSEEKIKGAEEVIKSGAQGMPWMIAQGTLAASALFGGDEFQADFEKHGRSSNKPLGLEGGNVEAAVRRFVSPSRRV
ncbi:uncharacterized protein AB675_11855 [Cyphellophora attinorum]|uniref:NAD(P)-binding domain-containing protein n=1 Tax=Cyphellophora attinorum TaxID=1664694 RepID=A0A0N1H668_9EURO|nr:uncharacterized protein AB675_11855 [Phialophora attinorum]KPI36746.1 hypothetical protein AB675_11855 [Phialophora attinorum]